jgi:hypothetical protein
MIQRPLCLQSISFTGFCEAPERGISGPIRFSIEPGAYMTCLELPAKVIESIEAYEKRTGVDRSSLLSLALKESSPVEKR